MYSNAERIQKEFDAFSLGFCGTLDPNNRWVQKAKLIPWDKLEPLYKHHFSDKGRPAKRFRVALGTLIIQETLQLTDREVVEAIMENVYLQFFLGFPGFRKERPFDASLLVYFRKRLKWEGVAQINDIIASEAFNKEVTDSSSDNNDDDHNDDPGSMPPKTCNFGVKPTADAPYPHTLIIDATCTPADIRHPNDLSLLDEVRRVSERLIDQLCELSASPKPRTYRVKARRHFLLAIKNKRKSSKFLRKAIGGQLRFIKRNLGYISTLAKAATSSDGSITNSLLRKLATKDYRKLLIINEIYRQQLEMFQNRLRSVSDRIVSVSQPHVRPIVRGKDRAKVEFGAKISVAAVNGLVFVDRISFDAYSESADVQLHAEAYKQRTGHWPDRILCDKAYQTKANRQWCKERGIHLSGKRMGRPTENEAIRKAFRKVASIDEAERVAVEGKIGVQKRRYGWGLVAGKDAESAKTMILLSVLACNLEFLVRMLGYFSICVLTWVQRLLARFMKTDVPKQLFWQNC